MRKLLVAAFAGALIAAPPASAHQGSPNMESIVRSITPPVPGLTVEVLNRDDRFELVNDSGRQVMVLGYSGEPYARLMPDGKVQVNRNSPAYYLNQDRYASGVRVPDGLTPRTAPAWVAAGGAGRFQWHDHRMHYMGTGVPPGVGDKSRRQVFARFRIPVQVGSREVQIVGDQVWTPRAGGGPPVAAIAALVVLLLAGAGSAAAVRRRRRADGGERASGDGSQVEVW